VTPEVLEGALVELAQEAGFEVRVARGGVPDADLPIASGVCRVRDSVWVVLSARDSLEERISALSRALVVHAPEFLEGRYLPPAVRECLASAAH